MFRMEFDYVIDHEESETWKEKLTNYNNRLKSWLRYQKHDRERNYMLKMHMLLVQF